MAFKFNIGDKGKSWKFEAEAPSINGKSLGDTISGKVIHSDLDGYELQITGGSDISGFPMSKDVEGIALKHLLLTKGWGMHKRPKGRRKKVPPQPAGLRMRKTVRAKTISQAVVQINLKVVKHGAKKLAEIFPDQNKPKEKPAEAKPADAPAAEAQ